MQTKANSKGRQRTNLGLSATDVLAVGTEGSDEVGGGEEAVLVRVHDAEGLLELLDGRVGEGVENVGFLRHGGGCWVVGQLNTCNTSSWLDLKINILKMYNTISYLSHGTSTDHA